MNSLEEKDVVVMMTIKSGKKYFFIKKKCSVLEKKFSLFCERKTEKKEEYFSPRFLDSNSIFFDVSSFVFPNNFL